MTIRTIQVRASAGFWSAMQLRPDPVEGGESVLASWLVSSLAPEAGGGWVNDSEPEAEFQEMVNKSKAMLKAVALAETFGL